MTGGAVRFITFPIASVDGARVTRARFDSSRIVGGGRIALSLSLLILLEPGRFRRPRPISPARVRVNSPRKGGKQRAGAGRARGLRRCTRGERAVRRRRAASPRVAPRLAERLQVSHPDGDPERERAA